MKFSVCQEQPGPEGTCTHGASGSCRQEPSFCDDLRARFTTAAALSPRRHTPQPAETGRRQEPKGSLQKFTRGSHSQRQGSCSASCLRVPW